ncbi:hypothetical protein [Vibrio vulnificus]|uniref:hypothetical protein n=2 Tax=Vibrio vulnificus TaxID=672 RepID=UPI0005F22647|nr:hypothetical protein [Vibrio vulnificus]ELL1563827.1 hypothetical protein [Vibrio cholerae]EIO4069450.1 hypothetical protein [Vibrio vulnificus]MCA0763664.1 hypothetical protein [Vibrio vulnificus]MDT9654780.1 hypothetical protein [Vibrio vulnificus]HAS6073233.1 hypothetical protein [Vibrio vulnificus]
MSRIYFFYQRFLFLMKDWFVILKLPFSMLVSILFHPSFIIFSVIALGLSTMGIWIGFFNGDTKESLGVLEQIDNLSVFTFCVATLGGAATDFFFEEKYKLDEGQDKITIHFMYFIWVLAFLTSFKSLKSDDWIFISLFLTISFWLAVSKNKPIFKHPNRTAIDNLNPGESKKNSDNEIGGEGL